MKYLLNAVQFVYVAVISGLVIDVFSIPLPDESDQSEENFGDLVESVNLTLTVDQYLSYLLVESVPPRSSRDVECCGKNKRSACCGANGDETSSAGCCGAEYAECCGATSNNNLDSDRTTRDAEEKKSCCGLENNESSCCGAQRVARQSKVDSKCCGVEEFPFPQTPSATVKRDASCCGDSADQTSEVPPSPESSSKTKREACCGVQTESTSKCCGAQLTS